MSRKVVVSGVLAGLMLSSVAAAHLLTPRAKVADQREAVNLENMIPANFGDWRVDPNAGGAVAASPDAQATVEKIYDQVLSRTYVNSGGERIMLTITYGSAQTQELKAHRQEVCYGAQGFEIRDLENTTLLIAGKAVPATRMFAVKGGRTEPVTYWFTMGDQIVMGRLERLMVQIKYSFAGVIPDGMLIRVSNITPVAQQGYDLQGTFLNDLVAQVTPRTAAQLLGTGQPTLR